MEPTWQCDGISLYLGDCRVVMAGMEPDSVDAVVCDPPYEINFMGQAFDRTGVGFRAATWEAVLRVAKPGAHLLAFGGTRTFHRLACAIEDAGWEIRDCLMWLYGQGFPKSLDVSKAIDKAAGAEREVCGNKLDRPGYHLHEGKGNGCYGGGDGLHAPGTDARLCAAQITAPATDAARQWDGWGTALKPAWEIIILARKPLEGTVAEGVQKWGCGALNIDGCRIYAGEKAGGSRGPCLQFGGQNTRPYQEGYVAEPAQPSMDGRWPANVVLSHHPECVCRGTKRVKGSQPAQRNQQSKGREKARAGVIQGYADDAGLETVEAWDCHPDCPVGMFPESNAGLPHELSGKRVRQSGFAMTSGNGPVGDSGSAARFFYCAKASREDRDSGLDKYETITVEWWRTNGESPWEDADLKVRLLVDTANSRPKVIGVSGAPKNDATEWSMTLFGNSTTAQSLLDSACTTVTGTSSTIRSKTLNLFRILPTNGSIAAASGEGMNGGSRVGIAELGTLYLTTTSAKLASALGAVNAASPMRLRISASEGKSGHPTVKPTDLMRWLCRLVTPPGGLILDPFVGSGSTAKAAIREGFRCAGIDQSAEYLAIAQGRIAHEFDRHPLFDGPKANGHKQGNLLEV